MEGIQAALTAVTSAFTTNGASVMTFIEGQDLLMFVVGTGIVGWIVGKLLGLIHRV